MPVTKPQNYRAVIAAIDAGQCKPLPEPTITESGCWIRPSMGFQASISVHQQIGRCVNGKTLGVNLHTLSLLYHNRDALAALTPASMACHKEVCGGERRCYNPKHLYLGDAKSNGQDTSAYGRNCQPYRKLSNNDVRYIRTYKHPKQVGKKGDKGRPGWAATLAEKFAVSKMMIYHIRDGQAYSDVPDDPKDDPVAENYADALESFAKRVWGDAPPPAPEPQPEPDTQLAFAL